MRRTVTTVEPDRIHAEMVEGRLTLEIESADVTLHLIETECGDTPYALAVVADEDDVRVAIDLTKTDVRALHSGLGAFFD